MHGFWNSHPHQKPLSADTPVELKLEMFMLWGSAGGRKTHHTFQLTAELLTLNTFDLNNRRKNTSNHSKDILWQSVLFCIGGKVQITATWESVINLICKPCLLFPLLFLVIFKRKECWVHSFIHSFIYSFILYILLWPCVCVSSLTSRPFGRACAERSPSSCIIPGSRLRDPLPAPCPPPRSTA